VSILPFPQPSGFVPSWDAALSGFLLFKRAEGASPRTLLDYQKHIAQFFNRFPSGLSNPALRASVLESLAEPISPATYNLRLVYLRAFFRWCVEEGYLAADPTGRLKRRTASARIVQLDLKVLKQLLKLPDRSTFAGLRDFVLFLLTLDCGIRPGEALSLLVNDVNLLACQVTIRAESAKTRLSRTLPISQVTALAIGELVKSRHPRWNEEIPLFCSASGLPLGDEWSRRVSEYGKTLGIRLRAYDLRHAFALNYLRNGADAFTLQKTLGHRDMAMTRRYVALTDQDLRTVHSTASPVRALIPERHRVRKVRKEGINHT
jgi:site-specific recombinase XerD